MTPDHDTGPALDCITGAAIAMLEPGWREGAHLAHAIASIEWIKSQCAWELLPALAGGLNPKEFAEAAIRCARDKAAKAPTTWPVALQFVFNAHANQLSLD